MSIVYTEGRQFSNNMERRVSFASELDYISDLDVTSDDDYLNYESVKQQHKDTCIEAKPASVVCSSNGCVSADKNLALKSVDKCDDEIDSGTVKSAQNDTRRWSRSAKQTERIQPHSSVQHADGKSQRNVDERRLHIVSGGTCGDDDTDSNTDCDGDTSSLSESDDDLLHSALTYRLHEKKQSARCGLRKDVRNYCGQPKVTGLDQRYEPLLSHCPCPCRTRNNVIIINTCSCHCTAWLNKLLFHQHFYTCLYVTVIGCVIILDCTLVFLLVS